MGEEQLSVDAKAIITEVRKFGAEYNKIERALDKLCSDVKAIRQGFPEGDPDNHRRYHEAIIERIELRNKIIRESLIHMGKLGIVGATLWFFYIAGVVIKMEFFQ